MRTRISLGTKVAICYILRLPHHTACLLFGDEHKPLHVMAVGVMVILCGTWINGIQCHGLLHNVCESSGMFVHGIGSYPIIEHIKRVTTVPKDNIPPQ